MREINEQLFEAEPDQIRSLVAAGANINAVNPEDGGSGLVHHAASEGWTEMLQALYENGADLNLQDGNGQTPLHISIVNGRCDSAQWLLEHGVDSEVMNHYERTPLIQAAQQSDPELCRVLIDGGAKVDGSDPYNWTPLHHAARFNRVDAMKVLVEKGADIDALGGPGLTPIEKARGEGLAYLQSVRAERQTAQFEANTAQASARYATDNDTFNPNGNGEHLAPAASDTEEPRPRSRMMRL